MKIPPEMVVGGCIKHCVDFWQLLTEDKYEISMVQGIKLSIRYYSIKKPFQPPLQLDHHLKLATLLKQKVIEKTFPSGNNYISPIFFVPKKLQGWCLILNLKRFNLNLRCIHFKMEILEHICHLVKCHDFMCSIDLSDAYYSLPIDEQSRTKLCFQVGSQLYQFTCLPNGYQDAQLFTKLLKTPLAYLCKQRKNVLMYLDDSWLAADSFRKTSHVTDITQIFQNCGFLINREKSVLKPTKRLETLGFILDSTTLTLHLPETKRQQYLKFLSYFQGKTRVLLCKLAKLIGICVSLGMVCQLTHMRFRHLERDKNRALMRNSHVYKGYCKLSPLSQQDVAWWMDTLSLPMHLRFGLPPPSLTLYTDASQTGWGAVCDNISIPGKFSPQEQALTTNTKELLAIWKGILSFKDKLAGSCFMIRMDNTTAISNIVKKGTMCSTVRDAYTRQIWQWVNDTNSTLFINHIAGVDNVKADFASHYYNPHTEWTFEQTLFDELINNFDAGFPDIDLFASELNYKTPKYVSFTRDPKCLMTNVFTLDWTHF